MQGNKVTKIPQMRLIFFRHALNLIIRHGQQLALDNAQEPQTARTKSYVPRLLRLRSLHAQRIGHIGKPLREPIAAVRALGILMQVLNRRVGCDFTHDSSVASFIHFMPSEVKEKMPNYCENDLYITGPKEDVAEAIDFMGSNDRTIDFEKIVPYPEALRRMDEEYDAAKYSPEKIQEYEERYGDAGRAHGGELEWCVRHWGTKWNAMRTSIRETASNGICISFETAWSPPILIVQALGQRFPTVRFILEYFETGCAFCGGVRINDVEEEPGMLTNQWDAPYHGHRGG